MKHELRTSFAVLLTAVMLALLVLPASAWAKDEVVVTLGANLTSSQRQEMLELFKVGEEGATVLEVTNKEERDYLLGLVPEEQIGTRAISSVYVHVKGSGGIDVQTRNITFVTPQTYANALVTAGVKDADVYAAAPFEVSGTAALTGIFKAFERATGNELSEEQKSVATEELVTTAEVGEQTGDQDKVAELIRQAKEEIVERGLNDPAQIRQMVINIAADLNINLTESQVNQIVNVLVKITNLNLDLSSITEQLKNFSDKINLVTDEAQGIWSNIKDFFVKIKDAIAGLFG